jgi:hypothetical protein
VLWHFTMSLDGFVADPNHELDWITGSVRPGLIDEYVETTGAVLGGRTGWDRYPDAHSTYGGARAGPLFVLTHHPADATPADGPAIPSGTANGTSGCGPGRLLVLPPVVLLWGTGGGGGVSISNGEIDIW